jgi:hypothetical protein
MWQAESKTAIDLRETACGPAAFGAGQLEQRRLVVQYCRAAINGTINGIKQHNT